MTEETTGRGVLIVVVVGVLLACCIGGYALFSGGPGSDDETYEADDVGAHVACQQFVEDRLRAPSTAKFPTARRVNIVNTADRWKVEGWVDAENAFGATIRSDYVCIVSYTPGDEMWHLHELEIE